MNDICYICMEDNPSITKLSCGCKIYTHNDCLETWLNHKSICLICKKEIMRTLFICDFNKLIINNRIFFYKIYSNLKISKIFDIIVYSISTYDYLLFVRHSLYINLLLSIIFPLTILHFLIVFVYLIIKNILLWVHYEIIKDVDKYFEVVDAGEPFIFS